MSFSHAPFQEQNTAACAENRNRVNSEEEAVDDFIAQISGPAEIYRFLPTCGAT